VRVKPAKRGRGRKRRQPPGENWLDKTPAERHVAMTWMQRLKRVFNWAASGSIRRRPHRDLRAVRGAVQDHRREASNRCIEERVSHHRGDRENPGSPEWQGILYRAGDAP
jgi:hypothetical protein